jgi:hypothetical protein
MDSLNEVVAGEGADGADLCRVQDFLFGLIHMDSKNCPSRISDSIGCDTQM